MRLSILPRPALAAISAALALALGAGCLDDNTDDEAPTGESAQELGTSYTLTTYYNNAAHTTEVGWCFSPSQCTGPSTSCSGTKTAFKTAQLIHC